MPLRLTNLVVAVAAAVAATASLTSYTLCNSLRPCNQVARDAVGDAAGFAAASACRAAAEPLIRAILKAHPASAQARIMETVRFQLGHLPLELAVTRGWGVGVVEAVLKVRARGASGLRAQGSGLRARHGRK
jgi:hypothetical protein